MTGIQFDTEGITIEGAQMAEPITAPEGQEGVDGTN
jgi:hypothetical protein